MDYESQQVLAVMFTKSDFGGVAYSHGFPHYTCWLYRCQDIIQWSLQLYIVGYDKTLHLTTLRVRRFITYAPDSLHAKEVVSFALWRIQHELLTREWYELMPRYQKAVKLLGEQYSIWPFTDEDLKRPIPLAPHNYWSNPL